MKNLKRYGAIAAIILILVIFCVPMFTAFGGGENSQNIFKASLVAAIVFPIILYAFGMAYKIWGKKKPEEDKDMENIIFDVGNVLVSFDWQSYLESFHFPKEKREKIADVVFRSNVWNERDRGSLSEEEYVQQMVDAAPEYEADIREVMRGSAACIDTMDYAEVWVKYLKEKGYHLYILSNYSEQSLKDTRCKMPFLKYMDGAVFSCDVKQIKPETDIYETLLSRYGLEPERSVFLDDREDNCAAAKRLGIKAIVFKDFKQAAAELEKMGIF